MGCCYVTRRVVPVASQRFTTTGEDHRLQLRALGQPLALSLSLCRCSSKRLEHVCLVAFVLARLDFSHGDAESSCFRLETDDHKILRTALIFPIVPSSFLSSSRLL
jgi:hypothetical protein